MKCGLLKMSRIHNVVLTFVLLIPLHFLPVAHAQPQRCISDEVFQYRKNEDQSVIDRRKDLQDQIEKFQANPQPLNKKSGKIKIPVVVHVLYNNQIQNILTTQIQSQIDRLNLDFQNLNVEKFPSGHDFEKLRGNANLEFCLAKQDPKGKPTTGITQTETQITTFDGQKENAKFTSEGGIDGWDSTRYLNIWVVPRVVEQGTEIAAYSTFPSELSSRPDIDGVVIAYHYFGTIGTVSKPYHLGRTATHEIGHWLNLFHIWGDDPGHCRGTDNVTDTPNQAYYNTGCPAGGFGPLTDSCSPLNPGVLYQDFLDYVDDSCMFLFSKGQVDRMTAILGTARLAITTSKGCEEPKIMAAASELTVSPNPAREAVTLTGLPGGASEIYRVDIFSNVGQKLKTREVPTANATLDVSDLSAGTYAISVNGNNYFESKKFLIMR